jgi:hypothetical protein
MNRLFVSELNDLLAAPAHERGLAGEGPLRVGARTVSNAPAGEVTAATVVGVVGGEDLSALERLVEDIAAEFDLDASLRLHAGSFSVRFSRRTQDAAGTW